MLDYTSENAKKRQWIIKMRAWCVQKYFETKPFTKIQEEFLHVFEMDMLPTKSVIFKMVKKFQCEGTVMNHNRKSESGLSSSTFEST